MRAMYFAMVAAVLFFMAIAMVAGFAGTEPKRRSGAVTIVQQGVA